MRKSEITIVYNEDDDWNEFIINELVNWAENGLILNFKIDGLEQIGN